MPVVSAARTHDHLYDPIYTTSSASDSMVQTSKLHSIERVPDYKNLFSDNVRYPRHNYKLVPPKLPPNLSMNPPRPPMGKAPASTASASQGRRGADVRSVLGANRLTYFKRPVLPYLQAVSADVLLAPSHPQGNGLEQLLEQEPPTKEMGAQTDYRESSTQTDPYTRDYITSEGQPDPEVLSLAHLKYGKGLPASQEEINYIHRMREKKKFEASLPPLSDPASFEIRRKKLEERELAEWKAREAEMRQEQEEKLQLLVATLRKRDKKMSELAEARVEKVRQKKMQDRDALNESIHHERIRVHRVLAKSQQLKNTIASPRKRDIVEEHSNYGSKVYAPKAREGRLPVKNQVVDYGIPLISNYQGICALENILDRPRRKRNGQKPKKKTKNLLQERKSTKIANDLEFCNTLLHTQSHDTEHKKIENVYRKFEPVVRAPTLRIEAPPNEDQERAILMLQRLLRGRAIQNTLFQGKEKAIHLIRELRVAEVPPEPQPINAHHAEVCAFETLLGAVVSQSLDFLTKEVIRVSETQKIRLLTEVATQTRRIREAEESGRRQAEMMLLEKHEFYQTELRKEHQASASSLLGSIIDTAVDHHSSRQAAAEAHVKSKFIDTLLMNVESKFNSPQIITQELVSNFLFPEVERKRKKSISEVENRRHIHAAHKTVVAAVQAMASVEDQLQL